jgi:hypothetical protein
MGIENSQTPMNSLLGQDISDCARGLAEFLKENDFTPTVGISAMLMIIVGAYAHHSNKEGLLKDIGNAWDHYHKQEKSSE